jgi:hypothetical protein
VISEKEFEAMLTNPKVVEHFENLELEIDDVVALFDVCSSDDGHADLEEFLQGALKLKTSAYRVDMVQVMQKQLELNRHMKDIKRHLRVQPASVFSGKQRTLKSPCSGEAQIFI